MFGGNLGDNVTYFIHMDTPNGSKAATDGTKCETTVFVQDAILTYRFTPSIMMDVGMRRSPLSHQGKKGTTMISPVAYGLYSFLASTPTTPRVVLYRLVPADFVRFGYGTPPSIEALACPRLFLHGPRDTIVPFEMGEALFRAAPEPKRFASLVGDHNSGGILESPEACRALSELLDAALGVAPQGSAQGRHAPGLPAPGPGTL